MTGLKTRASILVPWLAALALAAGCSPQRDTLQLADLSPNERVYVERFVTLERARAVALANPDRGDALLDSLGHAWGDTALEWTLRTLPREPRRVAGVFGLLSRILTVEGDSLVKAPVTRRLKSPVPDPKPGAAR
jgi:hypothetical protein